MKGYTVKEPKEFYFPLRGGLDLVTPPYQIAPGKMLDCFRYEIKPSGGYGPHEGYERVDGHGLPSEAVFQFLVFDNSLIFVPAGTAVTGSLSGATGISLYDAPIDFGSGDEDTAGTGAFLITSGVFEVGDQFVIPGPVVVTVSEAYDQNTEDTEAHEDYYHWLAVEARRALTEKVPGAGTVRGVWRLNGDLYAFRDDADPATECLMYKEDPATGWALVDIGAVITFTSGNGLPVVGQVITGVTSSATAIIRKINKTSGDWGADTAAGTIIVTGITDGPFTAAGEEITSATTQFTAGAGAVVETVLSPSGAFKFENTNFGGSASTIKMYGCDGKNKAFEFDGTTFVQITTGMAVDTPHMIFEHAKHLFLGFPNGSLQHSPPTDPTGVWTVVLDAGELGMGEELQDGLSLPGNALGIWCKDSIAILTGTGVGSWALASHSKKSGGVAGTVQDCGRILFLNAHGIADLAATSAYGSFKSGTVTTAAKPLLDVRRKSAVTGSVSIPGKNQYRIFFADGYFLTLSLDAKQPLITQGHFDTVVRCISAPVRADDELGNVYFGSDDGYVYKMDSGVSLDHEPMKAYCRLAYSSQGVPRYKKRYRNLVAELDAFGGKQISSKFCPDFTLNSPDNPEHPWVDVSETTDSTALWDMVNWDEFSWDSAGGGGGTVSGRIDAVATEIGLLLYFEAEKTTTPLDIFNGIFIYYNILGRKKE